jgi:hypothetical protein
MTPYLQILSRLLQSFGHINNSIDLASVFSPISLTEVTSKEDHAFESLAPIPVKISLFSFRDLENQTAELELNLRKDTGGLVNARVQVFFIDTNERNKYWEAYIKPFFSNGFQSVDNPKYPDISINEYHVSGCAIGVNFDSEAPFISTYITLEGLH